MPLFHCWKAGKCNVLSSISPFAFFFFLCLRFVRVSPFTFDVGNRHIGRDLVKIIAELQIPNMKFKREMRSSHRDIISSFWHEA